ncbi:hypothetical protein Tco_1093003 [Tanacetum coccineum]|uniref:Uncharacterized protein n=1 Tax=Tanacetum coccineum TaxID=301880 RepID=A0ABQ5ICR9_9ASTR
MDITRAEQIALDDSLVAPANRLKIGKSNLRLNSDLKSKEATLQVVYDVLKLIPFYKAFQITTDVPEIYMQEEMLQICPKLPNQQFEELPFEEAILTFLRDLGYSGEIKMITDVNVNKLHQPWRSFAAVINKCSGKSTGYDSLRLSQAQILWGMYHKKNVDYAYLLWEDFVYQVETRMSRGVMRCTTLASPKDDYMFTTIKVVSRHEDTQLYSAILPDKLTNEAIKDFESYKEYYVIASGAEPPKTKAASVKKNSHASGSGADEGTGDILGVPDEYDEHDDEEQGDDDEQTDSDNDGDDFVHPNDEEIQDTNVKGDKMNEEETNEEAEVDALYRDVNVNLEGRDTEMTDAPRTIVQTTQVIEDTHVIITLVYPKGQQQSSSVSSGFVSNMLNPSLDTVTTLPPPPTLLITHLQQTPVPTPPTVPSTSLQDLPNFGSLFGFDHRLKTLENNFLEFNQTNQFAAAVSLILGIVDAYLANKMHKVVKTVVQLQFERLKDEAQAKNADFINKLNDNIKKISKDQVKEQVKAQVSKILLKIEKTVNEQLEAEVLTRSSNESKTSHVVAANLSELELKKIFIDKMESNKSIHRSDEQKNLYKALVDAYESDKLILDTYRDTVSFKIRRDDEDKDEELEVQEKKS